MLHFRGLRKLSLVLGSEITDASVAAIASSFPNLELLDLSGYVHGECNHVGVTKYIIANHATNKGEKIQHKRQKFKLYKKSIKSSSKHV